MSELILALDIGTSSLKTALFDQRGRRLEKTTAHQAYALRVASDGTAALAVSDLEKAAICAMRATLLVRRQDRFLKDRPIAVVSTSCFWHSLLGYNAKTGRATPVYTWADVRCHADAEVLRARIDEGAYHARTGCMLRTPYWPAKLRWLARTGLTRGVTSWMSPAEWLYARFGVPPTASLSMASGTGLLDLNTGKWDQEMLRHLKIHPDTLGEISDAPAHASAKNSSFAIKQIHPLFPELANAAWYPALGDGAASNLGSDATILPLAALNVGTSAALRLVSAGVPRRIMPGLFCYRVDKISCLLGGAISNAGNLRAWALRQLRLPNNAVTLERALAARTSPSRSLRVLPFWTGERSPSWPEAIGGTITGINYSTTALDLLQALTESTYHRLAQIADLLEKQSGRSFDIVVSGGIHRSVGSMQRLANVLGRPIRTCSEPEASLRGAAVFALQQFGRKPQPLPSGRNFNPKPGIARAYAEARFAQILLEERTNRAIASPPFPLFEKD